MRGSVSGKCRIVLSRNESDVTGVRGALRCSYACRNSGRLICIDAAQMPVDPVERYTVYPAEDDWCVWDTARDEIVFRAERLIEGQARALARWLNEAYRGATIEGG